MAFRALRPGRTVLVADMAKIPVGQVIRDVPPTPVVPTATLHAVTSPPAVRVWWAIPAPPANMTPPVLLAQPVVRALRVVLAPLVLRATWDIGPPRVMVPAPAVVRALRVARAAAVVRAPQEVGAPRVAVPALRARRLVPAGRAASRRRWIS
jgi:hypothetical protein